MVGFAGINVGRVLLIHARPSLCYTGERVCAEARAAAEPARKVVGVVRDVWVFGTDEGHAEQVDVRHVAADPVAGDDGAVVRVSTADAAHCPPSLAFAGRRRWRAGHLIGGTAAG